MENRKKIKVVIVTNDLVVGGVQKLIVDQVNLLDSSKFDFSIISLYQFPGKVDFYGLIPEHVPVYKLNFKRFFDIAEWGKLVSIIKKEKPDIVKSSLFFSNVIVLFLKPFFKYTAIAAEHNTDLKRPWNVRFLNKFFSMFAYTIVADSNGVVDIISKTEGIKKEKFTVIYNGVELGSIKKAMEEYGPHRDEIRREIGLSGEDRMFLNVARLSVQKNHALMIDAFSHVVKEDNKAKLVVIGDGPLRSDLEKQINKLGLSKNVILLGERTDIYRFYAVSGFFLLTSLREGFCISAMNGLAFGLPLLSTHVAGVNEYLKDGENGFFLPNDPLGTSNVIKKLLKIDVEKLSSYKESAKKSAESYGVDTYIKKYEDLFTSAYNGKNSF